MHARIAAAIVAGVLLLTPAFATPEEASAQIQKFQPAFGLWTCESEGFSTSFAPPATWTSTVTFEPILDGTAAQLIYRPSPGGDPFGVELCWLDPLSPRVMFLFVGRNGVTQRGSIRDITPGRWTWEGTVERAGQSWRVRGTWTMSPDGQGFTQSAELMEGATWLRLWVTHGKRQASAPPQMPSVPTSINLGQ